MNDQKEWSHQFYLNSITLTFCKCFIPFVQLHCYLPRWNVFWAWFFSPVLFFCWKSIGYFLLWSLSVLNRTPVHLVHEILLVDDFSDDRKWTWKPEGLRRRERGNCVLCAHVLVHSLNLRETENLILEKRRYSHVLWFPIVPWHYNGLILFSILPLGVTCKCALSKLLTLTFWPLDCVKAFERWKETVK